MIIFIRLLFNNMTFLYLMRDKIPGTDKIMKFSGSGISHFYFFLVLIQKGLGTLSLLLFTFFFKV